jgi:hypothetical protein
MKHTAFALLLATLAAAPAAAQGKETETVDRTIAFSRGGTLKLKNFSGNVSVTGTASNDVVIHAVPDDPQYQQASLIAQTALLKK